MPTPSNYGVPKTQGPHVVADFGIDPPFPHRGIQTTVVALDPASLSFAGTESGQTRKSFTAGLFASSAGNFSYRRTFTVDHTQVPSTQTDFTVEVNVTDTTLQTTGGHVTNSNGYDIGFYSDSAGTTKLKWEMEHYDPTTGNVVAWVKISSLSSSSDNVFYMFYGNSSITTDQSDPTNSWDANYKAVYHMGDNAASTAIVESTTHSSNGVNNANTSTKTVTGQIGTALTYNGTTDGASAAINLSTTNLVTLSFWIKWTTNANDDDLAFEYTTNYNSTNGILVDWNASNGSFQFGQHDTTGGTYWTDNITRPSAGSWHLLHLVLQRSTAGNAAFNKAYLDGTPQSLSTQTHTQSGGVGNFDNSTLYFMSRATSSLNGAGVLDEVKVSTVERSADWATAEWNNQKAASTFLTMGSETPITASTTSFLKRTGKALSAALSFIGSIVTALNHAGTLYTTTLTAALSFVGAISKLTKKTFGGLTPVASDNFNRADGSLGANWTAPASSEASLSIVSNQVQALSAGQHSYAYWSAASFAEDQYTQIKLTSLAASWPGIILRADNSVDRLYLAIIFDVNDYRIYTKWDGAYNLVAQGTSVTWAVGDTMRFNVVGDTAPVLTLYQNGVSVLSTSPDPAQIKTGGAPGIGIYWPGAAVITIDDWEGGNIGIALSFIGSTVKRAGKSLSAALNFVGSISRYIRKALTGALSFIGNFIYPWRQTATLSFAGSIAKRTARALTGALSFIGAHTMIKAFHVAITATLSFVGNLTNSTRKTLTGTLSFVGSISKRTGKNLTGALSFIGTLVDLYELLFTATLNFVGSHVKSTRKLLTGALSFIGSSAKRIGKSLTGTLSFIGALVDFYELVFTATLSFVGAIAKSTRIPLSGTLSFIGSIAKQVGKSLSAALSFAGSSIKQSGKSLSAACSFIGGFTKKTYRVLTGTLSFSGFLALVDHYILVFTASLTFSGNTTKVLARTLTAALSFAGSLVKQTVRSLGAALSFVGSFVEHELNVILFTAALSFSGAITKTTGKALSGTLTFIGSAVKNCARSFTGNLSSIASFTKQTGKSLAGALSFIGTISARSILTKMLTAALSFSGSITKSIFRTLSGTCSFVGSSIKQSFRSASATLGLVGSTTKQTYRSLSAALSFIGSLSTAELITLLFTASLSFAGNISKSTLQTLSGTCSFVGSSVKRSYRNLSATLGLIGDIAKVTARALSGVLSFLGNLATQFIHGAIQYSKSLAASLNFSGSTIKRTYRSLIAAVSFIGSLATREIIVLLLQATLAFSGSITKRTSKAFTGILAFAGSITRRIYKLLEGVFTLVGDFTTASGHLFLQLLSGTLDFSGNLLKRIPVSLSGTLNFTGNIFRSISHILTSVLLFSGAMAKFTSRSLSGLIGFIGRVYRFSKDSIIRHVTIDPAPDIIGTPIESPVAIIPAILTSSSISAATLQSTQFNVNILTKLTVN